MVCAGQVSLAQPILRMSVRSTSVTVLPCCACKCTSCMDKLWLIIAVAEVAIVETVLLAADSMKVMAILMVVGVMDDARADILGDGNVLLSPVESVSQVS